MKILQKIAFVAITCLLIIGTFAVIGPKAVSAVVATMIRDSDQPARSSFQASFQTNCTGTIGSINCTGISVPTVNGAGQPVEALVIETVSGLCGSSSGPNQIAFTNFSDLKLDSFIGLFSGISNTTSTDGQFFTEISPDHNEAGFSVPTRLYAAAGSRLTALSLTGTPACSEINVSGYLVTP